MGVAVITAASTFVRALYYYSFQWGIVTHTQKLQYLCHLQSPSLVKKSNVSLKLKLLKLAETSTWRKHFLYFVFYLFFLVFATLVAYGRSWARDWISATPIHCTRPGIEPASQQWPEPLQRQYLIFNLLHHNRTPRKHFLISFSISFPLTSNEYRLSFHLQRTKSILKCKFPKLRMVCNIYIPYINNS